MPLRWWRHPRFGAPEIAAVLATLMTDVLGYRQFATQGGDWGSFITMRLAVDVPDALAADIRAFFRDRRSF